MSSSRPALTEDQQQVLNAKLLELCKDLVFNRSDRIKELIEDGADVNARDDQGKTPLMHAIEAENPYSLDALIKAGANINARDDQGKTPLMHAIEERKYRILPSLITSGADIDAKDDQGKTVLGYAMETADTRLIVDFKDQDDKTLLMLASEGRDKQIIEKIIKDYFPVLDSKDKHGKTALSYVLESVDDMSLAIDALEKSSEVREDDIINFVKKLKTPQEQVQFLSSQSTKTGLKTPLDKLIEVAQGEKREQYKHLKKHIQSIISSEDEKLVTFTLFEKILNKIIPDRFRSKEMLKKGDSKKAADIFRKKFQSIAAPSKTSSKKVGQDSALQTR